MTDSRDSKSDAEGAFDPLALNNPYGGRPGSGISLPDYRTAAFEASLLKRNRALGGRDAIRTDTSAVPSCFILFNKAVSLVPLGRTARRAPGTVIQGRRGLPRTTSRSHLPASATARIRIR